MKSVLLFITDIFPLKSSFIEVETNLIETATLTPPDLYSAAIKTSGPSQIVRFLSGGNQQKVVLAKWLSSDAEILIFDEPTRGIDVGARFSIYKLIADLAGAGKAIILISSDMTEVVGMAHRILVMNQGRITAELQGDQVNLPTVLQHCLGDEAECQKVTGEE